MGPQEKRMRKCLDEVRQEEKQKLEVKKWRSEEPITLLAFAESD